VELPTKQLRCKLHPRFSDNCYECRFEWINAWLITYFIHLSDFCRNTLGNWRPEIWNSRVDVIYKNCIPSCIVRRHVCLSNECKRTNVYASHDQPTTVRAGLQIIHIQRETGDKEWLLLLLLHPAGNRCYHARMEKIKNDRR